MGEGRSVEDRLREQYIALLPETRRVVERLETEVRYCLLPLLGSLRKYERLAVTARVKECESALGALRRRQEGATFDPDQAESYRLTALNDLAGVRVLAFPRQRWIEANEALRLRFPSWTSDPVPAGNSDLPLAFKYHGYSSASPAVRGELQIVSMLIGLFWQVENSAIYKPSPQLQAAVQSPRMNRSTQEVLDALQTFEEEFEKLVRDEPLGRA